MEVHPPAVDKQALDRPTESPYGAAAAAVFAGVSPLFDYESLAAAAELAPQLAFHVIGPPRRPSPLNVSFHPELPFDELVPYLQHATFGLLFFPPGYASLGQGNKVAQYSYCRLPIVAPSDLGADRPNVIAFERGDADSLRRALEEAERMPHSPGLRRGDHVCRGAGCDSCGGSSGTRKRVSRDQRPPVQPSTLAPTRPQKASRMMRNWTIPWLSTHVRHHSDRQ